MKTLFFLEAKCHHTNKTFYPRYDLAADDYWVLSYGLKSLPEDGRSDGESEMPKVENYRLGPQYKCPWCGNDVYVRCGACRRLTCHKSGEKTFTCAHCGNTGEVSGSIAATDLAENNRSSKKGQ